MGRRAKKTSRRKAKAAAASASKTAKLRKRESKVFRTHKKCCPYCCRRSPSKFFQLTKKGEQSLLRRMRAEAKRYHPAPTEPTEPTAALLLGEQMEDSAQVSTPEPVPPCSGSESACNRDVATSELVPNEEMNTSEPVPNEEETISELVRNVDLASGEPVPKGDTDSS
ncbi:uncharacterized protein LOC143435501 [Arvicanthis niloticus]|uniref:uncharacterized protein LOC143309825 n=1 Tax=Arvicanthis niloticus TaxID=61156 RepID=UPI00402B7BB9